MELTILMPCLNEAETVANCIRKANRFLADSGIKGEVLVADNGSTDGSQEIARAQGARVTDVAVQGYGGALLGGIHEALGKFIIMGDADDSYDFSALQPFMDELRGGADLVMGNRFKGGIATGAMPPLHRYLGNPVLSWLGALFFKIGVGDFHCGLRGFRKDRVTDLNLRTTGMEFATEMVVAAALAGYRIEEVPTTLSKDGRSRPPHLNTWHDGWRTLCYLLMYSPRWLFLYPGVFLITFGGLLIAVLLPGQKMIGNVGFDIHTFAVACMALLVGVQAVSFAAVARRFIAANHLTPPSPRYSGVLEMLTLERILIAAAVIVAGGLSGIIWCTMQWASTGFGPLQYPAFLRILILSLTAVTGGLQLALTGFLAAIMEIPTR